MLVQLSNNANYEGTLEVCAHVLENGKRMWRLFWMNQATNCGVAAEGGEISPDLYPTIGDARAAGLKKFRVRAEYHHR